MEYHKLHMTHLKNVILKLQDFGNNKVGSRAFVYPTRERDAFHF